MTSRDLRLHATVSELLAYLSVEEDPEKFLNILSKKSQQSNGNSYLLAEKISQRARHLSKDSPARFNSVFERLSSMQVKELEPLLSILSNIHSDPHVAKAVNAKSASDYTQTPNSNTSRSFTTGLSGSTSFINTSGLSHVQQTPRTAQLFKQRSQSNLNTPSSSRLNASTLMQTPIMSDHEMKSTTNNVASKTFTNPFTKLPNSLMEENQPIMNTKLPISAKDQEVLLIEDLLYLMIGFDGEFISIVHGDGIKQNMPSFKIDVQLEASLAAMVRRVLPHCMSYIVISRFIEEHSAFEYGKSHHALCASMRQILQEYHILVAQLEHLAHTTDDFTLHRLWYYAAPSFETLSSLESLVKKLEERTQSSKTNLFDINSFFNQDNTNSLSKTGGVLLSLLADRMVVLGGNDKTKSLYSHLLSESSKPYLSILKEWICNGVLDDPYNEFMVQENSSLSKDNLPEDFNDVYWDQRYTLQSETIPSFLEPYKEKILLTGKYLNVLRECSIDIEVDDSLEKPPSTIGLSDAIQVVQGERFLELIESGYKISNHTLLNVLRVENDLLGRLKSMKTFFLLDQSDYLTHFLDLALVHLIKPVSHISLPKVNSLLELVVRTPSTVSSNDIYKDSLSVEFAPISLFDQLSKINSMVGIDMKKHLQNLRSGRPFDINDSLENTAKFDSFSDAGPLSGIDSFSLNFNVTFPISLVLNKKIMTKYQMIFRHLFKCKYLERLLGNAWQEETKLLSKRNRNPLVGTEQLTLSKMSLLRGKMLHFIQQMIYFMFFEVINPHWIMMETAIKNATTVDGMMKVHDDFLDTCLKECMLTNPRLIAIFSCLITTCHSFVKFSTSVTSNHNNDITSNSDQNHSLSSVESKQYLTTLEQSFLLQIQSLIECIQILGVSETARLSSLVSQLDFNNYYSGLAPLNNFIANPIVPVR
ncbi:Spc98 family-domain-containing protein [Globomyces pollinis-pini]|nr:Spc98 family-domain-containing protein [Globomyces pollinis-pini]